MTQSGQTVAHDDPGAIEGSEVDIGQRESAVETVSDSGDSPAYQDALPNIVPPSEPRSHPIRQCSVVFAENAVAVMKKEFNEKLGKLMNRSAGAAFFIQSLRGKPLIVFNKYTYCRHSVRNGIIRWTCSTHSYKCCKAVVKTSGSHIIEVKGVHNHDASELQINRGKSSFDLSLTEQILVRNPCGNRFIV
ncbi:unnamed protein product, partial [Iphiclides podalirius]